MFLLFPLFFLMSQDSFYHFFFVQEISFSYPPKIGLVVTNAFRLPLFESALTSSLLKDIFTGCKTWIDSSFLWALEKCASAFWALQFERRNRPSFKLSVLLIISCCFFCFQDFFFFVLFLVCTNLTVIYVGGDLLLFILFQVHSASLTCRLMSFAKFGEISGIIYLNKFFFFFQFCPLSVLRDSDSTKIRSFGLAHRSLKLNFFSIYFLCIVQIGSFLLSFQVC